MGKKVSFKMMISHLKKDELVALQKEILDYGDKFEHEKLFDTVFKYKVDPSIVGAIFLNQRKKTDRKEMLELMYHVRYQIEVFVEVLSETLEAFKTELDVEDIDIDENQKPENHE